MLINQQEFYQNGLHYTIRSAFETDAFELSALRMQIDGETENLDREKGEAIIDTKDFQQLIKADTDHPRNIFLVAVAHHRIVGFSRCEGFALKRFSHKVEFGVRHRKKNFLQLSIDWADANDIKKNGIACLRNE